MIATECLQQRPGVTGICMVNVSPLPECNLEVKFRNFVSLIYFSSMSEFYGF